MSPELEILRQTLRRAASTEILPRFRQVDARTKADGSLVTAADLGTQACIIAELKDRFPGMPVLGEEMTAEEQGPLLADSPGGVWCLDPLDGTSNFAGGFPFFGVSLALLEGGEARLGLVLDPVRDECFAAERGVGAWLNGEPLRLARAGDSLKDCLALVDLKRLPVEVLQRLGGDAPYRSHRSLGAVALEWCWLAAGRAQLYLHGGQRVWDWAAGRLIASEAGVASRLLAQAGAGPSRGLSLEPSMAVAAANQGLLRQWTTWLGLPSG